MSKPLCAVLAASVLVPLGCRSQRAPDLRALIADSEGADAAKAGKARLRLIEIGEPAAALLAERLQATDAAARRAAATTLWGMGSKGRGAVPALAVTLTDADPQVRLAAAMALGNMGADAAAAVPALIEALRDPEGEVRQWAIKALGGIGPAASEALPALERATRSDAQRQAAEDAMMRIQGR